MTTKPIEEAAVGADFEAEITAKLRPMVTRYEARCAEWDRWFRTKGQQVCAMHGTKVEVDRERSIWASIEEGANRMVELPCPQCEEEAKMERDEAVLQAFGIPGDLRHATLDNWTAVTEDETTALQRSRVYANRPVGAAVIIGPNNGNGKSHLAVGILRKFGKGKFFTWMDLLASVRSTYRTHDTDDYYRELLALPLLVIDEVGFSAGGADEIPILHKILSNALGEKQPFILTGNFESTEAMRAVVGFRMYDRLKQYVRFSVKLAGPSKRQSRREEYLGLASKDSRA
jgi:DNA replication protein DnaC